MDPWSIDRFNHAFGVETPDIPDYTMLKRCIPNVLTVLSAIVYGQYRNSKAMSSLWLCVFRILILHSRDILRDVDACMRSVYP